VLVGEPCYSVQRGAEVHAPAHRGPNHAATHLGVPPRRHESSCYEPAFEPRTFFCRCMRARDLAGRTPARLGHDLATGEAQCPSVLHRAMRVDGHPWKQAIEP
jgi:hypothetical protein